jgi:transposase-like protein
MIYRVLNGVIMSNKRSKFDKEFKQKSVDMVIRDGLTQTEVSRRLGLGDGIIGKWVAAEKTHGAKAFLGKVKLKPEDEEMRRPRETRPRSAVRDRFSKKNSTLLCEPQEMRFALIDEFRRSIPTSHHVQSHASFLKAGLIAGAVAP